jgi:hypothetical protein
MVEPWVEARAMPSTRTPDYMYSCLNLSTVNPGTEVLTAASPSCNGLVAGYHRAHLSFLLLILFIIILFVFSITHETNMFA